MIIYGLMSYHFQYAVFKVHVFVIKFLSKLSGDNEIRTRDLLLARQALSQLSYTPIILASTYSPVPSPAKYHRPLAS